MCPEIKFHSISIIKLFVVHFKRLHSVLFFPKYNSVLLNFGFSTSKCRGDISREESSNALRARRFTRYQRTSLIQEGNFCPSYVDLQKLPLEK